MKLLTNGSKMLELLMFNFDKYEFDGIQGIEWATTRLKISALVQTLLTMSL